MTTHSMKSVSGQAVVAIDSAEEVGTVEHFVISPDGARIERLHIAGRRKKAHFAEWSDLESFGSDRVMVTRAQLVGGTDDDRDVEAAKGNLELIGARVLDTAGFEHGTVDDARFDATDGSITAITTSEGDEIPSDRIHSLGTYALVVDA